MDNHQLEGRLLLHPGTDIVSLIHEVHGRTSEMELSKEDHITVMGREQQQPVKVDELFEMPESGYTRGLIKDEAYRYQGARVLVSLNTRGTMVLNGSYIKRYVRNVVGSVRSGDITWKEAELLMDQMEDIGSSLD